MFINYKREIYALAHLNLSTASFKCLSFWSRGHLCMALLRLPMKFGADVFIQSGVVDIFPKLKMRPPPSWNCLGEPLDHQRSLIRGAPPGKNFVMIG